MANENREGYVKLGYEIDQGSINAVNQATAAVESRLAAVQKTTDGIGAAAEKTGRTLKDVFARSEASIKTNQKAVDDLRKSLDETATAATKANQTGGLGVEGLRRTGGALSAVGLGGLGGEVSKIGDIAEVTKEFQALAGAGKGLSGVIGGLVTAIGPVGIAVGALSVGAKVLSDGLANADAQIKKASDQISTYYQIIQTGTTDAIKAKIQQLEVEKRAADAELQYRETNLKDMQEKNLASARANLDFFGELAGELEQAGLRGSALTDKIKELKDKSADAKVQLDLYNKALGDSAVAANNATEYEKKLNAERLKGIDRQMASEIEYQELLKHGTSAEAKKKIEDLQIQADAVANAYSKALEGTDAESQKRAADLAEQYKQIKNHIEDLKRLVPDLEAGEKAKKFFPDLLKTIEDNAKKAEDAAKKAKAELDKQVQEVVDRDKRLADVQQKFNDASVKIDENDKAARLASFQKYEDTVAGIEQKSLEARADLQTKYADQLVDIARKAADDAAKALTDLEQKQADLRTSLGRDEAKAGRDAADRVLDIQIKAQREEKVALEEHLQRLKDIRRGDYVADQKDLLDRNFQSIYLRRLGQTQQMEQENTKFAQDRGKRDQTIRDEQQDAQRQAQIARRERLIAFEQANADAKLAYQRERAAQEVARQQSLREAQIAHTRELEQQRIAKEWELRAANQAYQRELTDLAAKLNREKATLTSAYDAELKAAATYGKARVEAERKTQQALLDQANARLRATADGSSGGSVRPAGHGVMERAGGGWLDAGQMSMVNEPGSSGRESFNGVPLPGAGLFIPAKAGYVNPNGGGGGTSITIPMTIVGATDPAATARAVDERLVVRLNQIFGGH